MTSVVVVGNPKPHSRTLDAASSVVAQLTGAPPDLVFDLADFGAGLLDWADEAVSAAVVEVQEADLVVVASPTYKGSYTGLLKLFLDRFGAGSLTDVTAVALMLGGDWRHSLAPQVFLTPVLAELGASLPTRGLFLIDAEWQTSDVLPQWLAVARRQLPARLLG